MSNKIYSQTVEHYVKNVIEVLSIKDKELNMNFFEAETPEDPDLGKKNII